MRVLQLLATILCCAAPVLGAPVEGSLPLQWNIGAGDCKASPQPPLQVHAYETQTFILRESPCADPEANFLYLLIGSEKALLIDTGAVADPSKMPLARNSPFAFANQRWRAPASPDCPHASTPRSLRG